MRLQKDLPYHSTLYCPSLTTQLANPLTPWSWALLQKLTVAQLVKKLLTFYWGCAIAQVVSCWLPTAAARVSTWGLWWTKWHWGRFSQSTSVSPANHHSTNFSIIIIPQGRSIRPTGGHCAKWSQLDSTPAFEHFIES
jgi:hypothetical protein